MGKKNKKSLKQVAQDQGGKKKKGWASRLMGLLAADDSDDSLSEPSDDETPVAKTQKGQKKAQYQEPADVDSRDAVSDMLRDPQQKKEVYEFAQYLGMDPVKEERFLWIAVEAMTAPLPKNWQEHETDEGQLYYYNTRTKRSQWEHPMDDYHKQLYTKLKEEEGPVQPPAAQGSGEEGGSGKNAKKEKKKKKEDAKAALDQVQKFDQKAFEPSAEGFGMKRAEEERAREEMSRTREKAPAQGLDGIEKPKPRAVVVPEVEHKPLVDPEQERQRRERDSKLNDKLAQLQDRIKKRKEGANALSSNAMSELEKQKMEKMRNFISGAKASSNPSPSPAPTVAHVHLRPLAGAGRLDPMPAAPATRPSIAPTPGMRLDSMSPPAGTQRAMGGMLPPLRG